MIHMIRHYIPTRSLNVVKLTLLFRHPAQIEPFEADYNRSLALLEQMPGILRRQANLVFGAPGGQSPYYRVLEFYFVDRQALDAALLSPAGTAAGRAVVGFAGREVELLFSEVFEEVTN